MSGAAPHLDARGLPHGYPLKPEYEITPRDAASLLALRRLVLVDVRTAPEVEVASIPGALHLPLDQFEARFDEVQSAIEENPGAPVAFLCHHGVRSMRAALAARAMGVEGALSIAGGIDVWSQAVDASVPRYERGPGGTRPISGQG